MGKIGRPRRGTVHQLPPDGDSARTNKHNSRPKELPRTPTTETVMQIRRAEQSDGAAFAAIYDPVVANHVYSFEAEPPGAAEMSRRVARITQTFPWLAAEENGDVVGYTYASPHRERAAYRWAVDLAIYVAEHARRRGVATALYNALFPMLAELGYRRALAGISLPNEPSIELHRRFGFEAVGVYRRIGFKFDAWHDVSWWCKSLGDEADAPQEPRKWQPDEESRFPAAT